MPDASHHDLIFGHEGDVRVAASVVVAGMLAVLVGGAFMAIGPELKRDASEARNAAGAGLAPVRVIGAAPRDNGPCEQQVWPNIDQRCLVRADNAAAAPNDAKDVKTTASNPPAAQESDKLSPLTAASVDHPSPPQDDETTGSGVQEDTALLRQTAPINMTASPDVDDDDVADAPPPAEQPRRHERRHVGFPFHLRFGGFRF